MGEETDHHLGFAGALEKALRRMDEGWHGRGVSIQFEAWITPNPGAVGEYRVHCTSP